LRLTLDRPLSESYQHEPLAPAGDLTLNDAAAKISGSILASDYFDADDSLVVGTAESQWVRPFPSAYSEYVVLPPQPATQPNLVAPLPRMLLEDTSDALAFVDKWFRTPTPQPLPTTDPDPFAGFQYNAPGNHQLLLIGDAETGAVSTSGLGMRLDKRPFEKAAVVSRAAVEAQVGVNGALCKEVSDTVLEKTEVHELTHLWNVNEAVFPGAQDHCVGEVGYNSGASFHTPDMLPGTLYCTMSGTNSLGMTDPTTVSNCGTSGVDAIQFQYGNGIATFHVQKINGLWNSEYLSIRNVLDPWKP
jgi:hypothetical protein